MLGLLRNLRQTYHLLMTNQKYKLKLVAGFIEDLGRLFKFEEMFYC